MLIKGTRRYLLLMLLLSCFVTSAMAQERVFPLQARRGKLSVTALADILIDGKLKLTTPATRIYNEDGLIVVSSSLDNVNAPVNYTVNEFGEVERIWILTAQEASKPVAKK